jgi:hypothetical protein
MRPTPSDLAAGAAPTADPLPRFLALQRHFASGRPRTLNFNACGFNWRLYYRYFGEGGIAFPDSAQDERYRSLTDEQRSMFAGKLRSLVDAADLRRIRQRNLQRRFHHGMQLAAAPIARLPIGERPRCSPRPRSREQSPRRACRAAVRRRGPPASDDPSEPDLAGPCPLRGPDALAAFR